MAISILDPIKTRQGGIRKSVDWYRKNVADLNNRVTATALMRSGKLNGIPSKGRLNFFFYDPKYKKVLPLYDRFPLVLPIETIPEFITKLDSVISLFSKDVLVNCFGHVGDGNLHYNIFPLSENTRVDLEKKRLQLLNIVNDLVNKYSGSISAEHGIGRLKVSELNKFEDPGKVYMMKLIKSVVDPKNLLNPGVIF